MTDFSVKDTEVSFKVEGTEDAQITISLKVFTLYKMCIRDSPYT